MQVLTMSQIFEVLLLRRLNMRENPFTLNCQQIMKFTFIFIICKLIVHNQTNFKTSALFLKVFATRHGLKWNSG